MGLLIRETCRFVRDLIGEMAGAAARYCGNSLDMNLPMAGYHAERYLEVLEKAAPETLRYPE